MATTKKKTKRTPKYKGHVLSAIDAAKLSVDMFNRVEGTHKIQGALIFNTQAWELLAKGMLIRAKEDISVKGGSSISAERAINKIRFNLEKISKEEAQVIQQIISLRHEAMHGVLPKIPDEITTHLMYFSVKSFRRVVKDNFRSYFKDFDKNFLSIAFNEHTFYSDKVSKLFSDSRNYGSEKNRLLYLLDRGVEYSDKETGSQMRSYEKWQEEIKKLPRKSRVAMHLDVYKHMNVQEDVRFVPVETKKGFKPEVILTRSKNTQAPVLIKKTDPNVDYPHSTSEIAKKVGRNQNFVARMAKALNIKNNEKYCYVVRTSKSSVVPKYSEAALQYVKEYLKTHPNYNPYK